MRFPRKSRLAVASMFVLMLGSAAAMAQSGTGGSKGSGTNSSTARPATPPAPSPDFTRPIILTGNVVTADGSSLPKEVAIERVCGGRVVREGYTDSQGYFTLQVGGAPFVTQDASENGRAVMPGTQSLDPGVFGGQPPAATNPAMRLWGCELRASLAGFQSSSVMVLVPDAIQPTNVGTIVLQRSEKPGSTVSATSMSAPKDAKKAFEKARTDLQKHKLAEAQAELEKAVKSYPRYAAAWTELGWLHAQQGHLEQAREAFSQARTADEQFAPSYVGLASVAVRESKWAEAQELSARATQSDGVDFPVGFYYNALSNFQLGQTAPAEKAARMAEKLDARGSLPQVRLLLGAILARKQDYAGAAEEFKLYLKLVPSAANADKVRQQIAESADGTIAEKLPPLPASAAPLGEPQLASLMTRAEPARSANNPAVGVPPPQAWAPPDIDQATFPVAPGISCPEQQVLSGVSLRVQELMENLQQFSATERIEHVEVDKKGNPRPPAAATFKYVAQIREPRPGYLSVEEYRNGASTGVSFPANLATMGVTAHALLFHPTVVDDLTVTCEGLGRVRGQPAWQLYFAQRPGRPPRFREYRTNKGSFWVEMKGRAWISPETFQVLRMETDLAKPIREIALQKDHMIIEYAGVDFRNRNVRLWLPEMAEIYMDFLGHRSYRRHSFSNFELFWVDVAEKTQEPQVQPEQP